MSLATLLAEALHAASGLREILTSREPLAIRQEWLMPVDGLNYPTTFSLPADWYAALAEYSALDLFYQRIKRRDRNFDPAQNWNAMVRICRHVEGMPLALELTAYSLAFAYGLLADVLHHQVGRQSEARRLAQESIKLAAHRGNGGGRTNRIANPGTFA